MTDAALADQLTLLITTKNRSDLLERVLRYDREAGLSCGVLISDASDEAPALRQTERLLRACAGRLRITYRRDPADLIQSLRALLEQVRTPLVLIAGDDDFFVPSALARCARFLLEHSDYNSACGDILSVYTHTAPDGRLAFDYSFADEVRSLTDPSPAKRVARFYTPQTVNTTYCVQRTEHLRYSVDRSARLRLYLPQNAFSECTLTSYTLLKGKLKYLPGLYHVRLRHRQEPVSKAVLQALDYGLFMHGEITKPGWAEQLRLFVDVLADDVMRHDAVDRRTATAVAETVFLGWFAPRLTRNRDQLLAQWRPLAARAPWRTLAKRVPGAAQLWDRLQAWRPGHLSLVSALKASSPYHQEFAPIYRALTERVSEPAVAPVEVAA